MVPKNTRIKTEYFLYSIIIDENHQGCVNFRLARVCDKI